jgi:hypothetical protein
MVNGQNPVHEVSHSCVCCNVQFVSFPKYTFICQAIRVSYVMVLNCLCFFGNCYLHITRPLNRTVTFKFAEGLQSVAQ